MKKKVFGRKLSRDYGSRKALFRALTRSFVLNGSIITTKAKAKAISASVEKLVTAIKKGSLAHIRRVSAKLANDRKVLTKLIKEVAPAFSSIKGGYTKLISLPTRRGDNAEMAKIVWTKEIGNLALTIANQGKRKVSKNNTGQDGTQKNQRLTKGTKKQEGKK
ncbi:MAG: 50S ribosomal protein L17 [Patescibacteria group bacterium]|nr:50S ribosomal protein L17 [Patescibacteria group bacterium]